MTCATSKLRLIPIIAITVILLVTAACTPKVTTPESPTNTPLPPISTNTELPTLTSVPTATLPPTSTNTPEPPMSVMIIPGGSKVVIKPDTVVEVIKYPGYPGGNQAVELRLTGGEVLVIPQLSPGSLLTVFSGDNYAAHMQGCAMIVEYSEPFDRFGLKCVEGDCEFSIDASHRFAIKNGKHWTYEKGTFLDPVTLDHQVLSKDWGLYWPSCVPMSSTPEAFTSTPLATASISTQTPTSTSISTATFPPTRVSTSITIDTPDPRSPNLTATAACAAFRQKFSSTVCP